MTRPLETSARLKANKWWDNREIRRRWGVLLQQDPGVLLLAGWNQCEAEVGLLKGVPRPKGLVGQDVTLWEQATESEGVPRVGQDNQGIGSSPQTDWSSSRTSR